MCGICFILGFSEDEISTRALGIQSLINCRGPDVTYSKFVEINKELTGLFRGSVLWMQGESPQKQPVVDKDGNIFLWNGDDFRSERNLQVSDTTSIFEEIRHKSEEDLLSYISSIEGPWSFVYYSSLRRKLYFGRDLFGRHSLLWTPLQQNFNNFFILCSVGRREDNLQEVPALGIYSAEIASLVSNEDQNIFLYPFNHITSEQLFIEELKHVKILNYKMNHNVKTPLFKELPSKDIIKELKNYPHSLEGENLLAIKKLLGNEIQMFSDAFKQAMITRIEACPSKCKNCTTSIEICSHTRFAVLFSGGLDSALIALFLTKCLPSKEHIDLLNVSFESRSHSEPKKKDTFRHTKSEADFNSPDRKSGLMCWNQLQSIDPSRTWNFIEINVTGEELQKERDIIIQHLISPHSSVLDDSIGCALYFCGRGTGLLSGEFYSSSSRVVFSGLGADEQLAGYSRHRGRFSEAGWSGLLDEVRLEMERIHGRNCGRDDRVLSHHGRTVRFPYLDEKVVNCLNSFPMWKKANLYLPRGLGEKLLLRSIAALESLSAAAVLPKKAIQFGSRIAKLENRKEKGRDICQRLGAAIVL